MKDWFERLKQADARLAPSFSQSWAAAIEHRHPVVRWNYRLAVALAALVVLVVAIVLTHRPRAPVQSIAQLSAWHSPTAFLLDMPGRDLWKTTPHFGAPFAQSEAHK